MLTRQPVGRCAGAVGVAASAWRGPARGSVLTMPERSGAQGELVLAGELYLAPDLEPVAGRRLVGYAKELLHFGLKNARACIFPVAIFLMLGLSQVVPLPVARCALLLHACLAVQPLLLATGVVTSDELKVILLY